MFFDESILNPMRLTPVFIDPLIFWVWLFRYNSIQPSSPLTSAIQANNAFIYCELTVGQRSLAVMMHVTCFITFLHLYLHPLPATTVQSGLLTQDFLDPSSFYCTWTVQETISYQLALSCNSHQILSQYDAITWNW